MCVCVCVTCVQPALCTHTCTRTRVSTRSALVQRRNRRVFGALLGTLRKFKESETADAATDVSRRRMEVETRAAQRASDAVAQAREQQR